MGRICSEVTYRARLIAGWPSLPAPLGLGSTPETQLLEYRIVIQSEFSQKADRLAGLIEGFCLRLCGDALDPRFQFFDLFDCLTGGSFSRRPFSAPGSSLGCLGSAEGGSC
jgi:hypothetical protein